MNATLTYAVTLALDHDNLPGTINLDRWAITYGCSPQTVEAEFEKQKRARLTKVPPNSIEGGDGK